MTEEINNMEQEIKKNLKGESNEVVEARLKILEHFGPETYKSLFEEMIISTVPKFRFQRPYIQQGTEAYGDSQKKCDQIYGELQDLFGQIELNPGD